MVHLVQEHSKILRHFLAHICGIGMKHQLFRNTVLNVCQFGLFESHFKSHFHALCQPQKSFKVRCRLLCLPFCLELFFQCFCSFTQNWLVACSVTRRVRGCCSGATGPARLRPAGDAVLPAAAADVAAAVPLDAAVGRARTGREWM